MSTSSTPAWCALKIEHDYFSHLKFTEVIDLQPTRETQRYRVAIRPVGNEALVYAPPQTARPPSIGFGITFRDPKFGNYTDFNDQPPIDGKVLYLNPGQNDTIDIATAPRLDTQPRRFEFPFEGEIDAAQVGPIGGKLHTLKISPDEQRRQSLFVNLEGEPAGGYTLRLTSNDQVVSETNFYVSDLLAPPLAAFEWRPDPATEQPPTLTLKFKARETYWRYHIMGLPEDLWSVTSIAPATTNGNGSPGIAFTAIDQPYVLPDGRKALVYLSDQPIPRRQHQRLKVKLKSTSVFDGYQLPHASNHLAFITDPLNEQRACSDIFVQL